MFQPFAGSWKRFNTVEEVFVWWKVTGSQYMHIPGTTSSQLDYTLHCSGFGSYGLRKLLLFMILKNIFG
jgi:hypothetical protein